MQCSIAYHQPYLELIERLLPMMPHPSLDSFFFWTSGSEAVEAGIKMARAITGRQNIINMQGAYHGRTMGAMAVTKSKTIYSAGFHPLMVRVDGRLYMGMLPDLTYNVSSASRGRSPCPTLTGTSWACLPTPLRRS